MSISSSALVNSTFTNPAKGSSRISDPNTKYVGIITRIVGSQVILKIPKLNAVTEFGPCDVYCEFPKIGDSVICGYIDGRFEHIVVFGKKATVNDNGEEILQNQVFG